MVIAADYPFLDVLWTIMIFFPWVIWIWMMVTILSDVFRRRDIGGWAKASWCAFLIVLPFLGALIYIISQHDHMAERSLERAQAAEHQFDARVRAAGGTDGASTRSRRPSSCSTEAPSRRRSSAP